MTIQRFRSGSDAWLSSITLFTCLAIPSAATALGEAIPLGGLGYSKDVVVADFNGDGRSDLVVLHPYATDGSSVLISGGGGTFATSKVDTGLDPWLATSADLNGDGHQDLVVVGQVWSGGEARVFLGAGDGTFGPGSSQSLDLNAAFGPGTYATAVAVGDLHGDGNPDVIVAASAAGVVVLAGRGDGTLSIPQPEALAQPGMYEMALAVGDLTGDGLDDVAVCGGQSVALLPSNGVGFDPALSWTVVSGSTGFTEVLSLAAGDVNLDGVLDLVAASTDGQTSTIHTLLGPGQPGYDGSTVDSPVYRDPAPAMSRPGALILADFDGNLSPEVVLLDRYEGKVVILTGVLSATRPGRFANLEPIFPGLSEFPQPDYPEFMGVGDFDGDLVLDFTTSGYSGGMVHLDPTGRPPVQDTVGDQVITEGQVLSLQITARLQEVGLYGDVETFAIVHLDPALDLNGDGHIDLTDIVRVQNATYFGAHEPGADFNGDGVIDQVDWNRFVADLQLTPPGIAWDPDTDTLSVSEMTLPGTYTVTAFSFVPMKQARETFTITVLPMGPAMQLSGATASASTSYSTSYSADKVLDGVRYSYWIGTPGERPWTLTLDLHGERTLDRLELDWLYTYTSSDFDVEVSSDGVTFVPLHQALAQTGVTAYPYIATTDLDMHGVRATHVRVVIHQEVQVFPVVSELRVFGW